MGRKLIDISGKRFGNLTVVERAPYEKGKESSWICRCDCGETTKVTSSNLRSGRTKSCGCSKSFDLIGETVGLLTVVANEGHGKWRCQCKCGNTHVVTTSQITCKNTKSCGCLKHRVADLTGRRFGRLLVLGQADEPKRHYATYWKCRCDCGREKVVNGNGLKSGAIKSCGCYGSEMSRKNISDFNATQAISESEPHYSKERLYYVWRGMRRRCSDPKDPEYKNYGARGIAVCPEWESDYFLFRDWALAAGYDETAPFSKCTIDRINNDKGYFPENCRWVDMSIQQNNKRVNRILTVDGESHTISDWGRIASTPHSTIRKRMKLGWGDRECVYGKERKSSVCQL